MIQHDSLTAINAALEKELAEQSMALARKSRELEIEAAFEKVRDRNVWDFPLLNVASAMMLSGDTIQNIRIAVNGAAARPLRLKAVEDSVRGKQRNATTGEMAGKLAVQGAVPLQFNAYKIPLMRNLVKRSISGVQEAAWAS